MSDYDNNMDDMNYDFEYDYDFYGGGEPGHFEKNMNDEEWEEFLNSLNEEIENPCLGYDAPNVNRDKLEFASKLSDTTVTEYWKDQMVVVVHDNPPESFLTSMIRPDEFTRVNFFGGYADGSSIIMKTSLLVPYLILSCSDDAYAYRYQLHNDGSESIKATYLGVVRLEDIDGPISS